MVKKDSKLPIHMNINVESKESSEQDQDEDAQIQIIYNQNHSQQQNQEMVEGSAEAEKDLALDYASKGSFDDRVVIKNPEEMVRPGATNKAFSTIASP